MSFEADNGGGRLGFGIDRGGTFTDVVVVYPDRHCRTFKLLSEDPHNYADAPTEAIRRILEEHTGLSIPRGQSIQVFSKHFLFCSKFKILYF
jgi:5-oxoprolinase (ATP-hydrolysing)